MTTSYSVSLMDKSDVQPSPNRGYSTSLRPSIKRPSSMGAGSRAYPDNCPFCGASMWSGMDHYYASEDCWRKHQAELAEYFHRLTAIDHWSYHGVREAWCQRCGCRFYESTRHKHHSKCAPCVRATIYESQRRRRVEKQCVVCHSNFSPKRADSLYCSGRCRQKAYRIRYANN